MPNLMMEVYFGYAGKHAAMFAGSQAGAAHMHELAMHGGLLLCVAVLVFLSRFARKAVMQAVAENAKAKSPVSRK